MIMTAHLNFPALDDSGDPATLSKPIMTGLLRGELGYRGVIVTDSLAMQGVRDLYGDAEVAVRALDAGVDQLLMTPAMDDAYAAVLGAVRSGRISHADLDAKVRRVLELKYAAGSWPSPTSTPASSTASSAPRAPRHRGRDHRPHDDPGQERQRHAAAGHPGQEGARHRLRRGDHPDPGGRPGGQGCRRRP